MFCDRCGTKIPDGQTQCPNCKATPRPVQQNVNYAQQVKQPGSFQLNTPTGMPGRPRKKKSGMTTALLVGGVVLVLLAVILIAVFSGVFASPEARLEKMEKANAKLIAEAVSQAYGDYVDSLEESQKQLDKGMGVQADIELTVNENLLSSLLYAMVGENMSGVNMNWLNSVLVRLDLDAKGTQMDLSVGVCINDTVLATVDALTDADGGKMFLGIPELNQQYLTMDLEQMDVDLSSAYAALEPAKKLAEELPSEKEVKKMLDTYLQIVMSYTEAVDKAEETVTVGGETKKMTVLKAKITEAKLLELVIKMGKTAQEDETLKKLVFAITNFSNAINEAMYGDYYYGYTPEEAYADLMMELADGVETLEEQLQEADQENYLILSNYISGGMIVGRRLQLHNAGEWYEEELIHCLFVPGKNGGVFEAVVPSEELKISGVVSGDEIELSLEADGEHLLTVNAQELEVKNGVLNGQVQLKPSDEMVSELFYAMGMGYPTYVSQDTYLQLRFDGSKKATTTEVALVVGGNTLVGVTVDAKEAKYNKITMPASAISASSESDLMIWVAGIQFDKLIANMQTAGVPNEYVQVVQQLESMLKMGMIS